MSSAEPKGIRSNDQTGSTSTEAGIKGDSSSVVSPSSAAAGPSSSTTKPAINLTTLDKIKRFFFSKEEWEAYLMEKLEEQEKKQGGDITLETKSDSTTKKNVVSWLKTVFPSQEDANSFLKSQIDKMQEDQQSIPTSPQPSLTAASSPSAASASTVAAFDSTQSVSNQQVTTTSNKSNTG